MKKLIMAGLGIFSLALVSCKKDYTCECTTNDGSGSTLTSTTTILDASKSGAKAYCTSTKDYYYDGVASTGYSQTCTLK
jgi:uncharacterized protein YvpB